MAQGIKNLYYDAAMFLRMSENSAQRVRNQSSKQFTITREIEIIGNK